MRKQRHERHFSVGLFLYLRRLQNTERLAHCTFPSCKLCFTTLILAPTLWPLACTHTRNKTKFAFGTSAPARVQNPLYLLLCLNRQRLLNTATQPVPRQPRAFTWNTIPYIQRCLMVWTLLDYFPLRTRLALITVSNPLHIIGANTVAVTSLWRTRIFFTGVVISNKKNFKSVSVHETLEITQTQNRRIWKRAINVSGQKRRRKAPKSQIQQDGLGIFKWISETAWKEGIQNKQ